MKESLYKKLEQYSQNGKTAFHMPGHKRRGFEGCPTLASAASVDITEIADFDDLAHPCGVIREIERKGERLYGSERCLISTNGSTGGILAAIRTASIMGKRSGKSKIAVARNCHKSVYNGVQLSSMTPCYILPEMINGWGCYGSVSVQSVRDLFESEKDICALVITSPTYEGIVSDIESIAEVVHEYGAILIVDEAHGSHLPFMYEGIKGASTLGGDIVINSLHKHLSTLTQAAAVHIGKGSVVEEKLLACQMRLFNTSSPSYPIMASIDYCFDELINGGASKLSKLLENIKNTRKKLEKLENLKILKQDEGDFALDLSKIVVSASSVGMSGYQLAEKLRCEYEIECESANMNYVIAMAGENTTATELEKLTEALTDIDSCEEGAECEIKKTFLSSLPLIKLIPEDAVLKENSLVSISDAKGMVSSEYLWLYPPGIPFIVPGEIIGDEAISIAENYGSLVMSQRCEDEFDGMIQIALC